MCHGINKYYYKLIYRDFYKYHEEYMKIILQLLQLLLQLLLFSTVKSFSIVPRFREYGFCLTTPIMASRTHIFNMEYSQYKNFDDIINILPEFHTRIIINNWLKYVAPQENSIEDLIVEYERGYSDENKIDNKLDELKFFPDYVIKSLYDFKIFIAINREEKNLIYFGWCPETHLSRPNLVYIIAGKVVNNTIYIYRIAQNPYYNNMLNINSIDLIDNLEKIEYRKGEKFIFNYDNLHEYDNRYNISWNYHKKIL